eukprot:TRINITY_DN12016_c0_g2_i1.p1 TRINITY_DN12016_c0_g2~~TRINITY_DN12016_c0_g2_i1.p1  ORF type:complete len:485 (-),score=21.66 TRINITY_DN12016_c0_g2_i1:402-1760(-)
MRLKSFQCSAANCSHVCKVRRTRQPLTYLSFQYYRDQLQSQQYESKGNKIRKQEMKGQHLKFKRVMLSTDFRHVKNPESFLNSLKSKSSHMDASNVGIAILALASLPRRKDCDKYWPKQKVFAVFALEILLEKIIEKVYQMDHLATTNCLRGLGNIFQDIVEESMLPQFYFAYEQLVERLRTHLQKCKPKNVGYAIRSLGVVRYYDEVIFQQLEQEISIGRWSFDTLDVGNILVTFAQFGYCPEAVVNYLVEDMVKKYKGNTRHGLVDAIYALAILDYDVKSVQYVLDVYQSQSRTHQAQLADQDMWKLKWAQTKFSLQGQLLEIQQDLLQLSTQSQEKRQIELLQIVPQFNITVYNSVRDIFPDAIQMGLCQNANTIVDIVLCDRRRIGIRVYDDYCVVYNFRNSVIGSAIAETEMLRSAGWTLVEVYQSTWNDQSIQEEVMSSLKQLADE